MLKLLLIVFLITTLFGSNPQVYTQLGNPIYNNIEDIQSLKDLDSYAQFQEKIDTYSKKVKEAKLLGFAVQDGSKIDLKLKYLDDIRKLNKVNEYFLRTVRSSFFSSLKTNNNHLFIEMVNSGLLDTSKYKKEIMRYYNMHQDGINPRGIIQGYIDEDYAKKHKKKWVGKTKKQLHEEKVLRLRASDKLKRESLENRLAVELKKKKEKIRQEQEQELFN